MKLPQEFKVPDYSVSKEEFTLCFNTKLQMYETVPQPSKEQLPKYYRSEDYISHTNSKRNLFERVYHTVRVVMLRSKLSLISKYSKSESLLLDVGCGTGDFLVAAQSKGWNVKGIEPNTQAREIAASKGVQVFDLGQLLEFEEGSFDVITLWHVLEHLPRLDEHISLFKKLLKTNGLLVVAVPNFKSYDASYYGAFWAAFDTPRHLWHFSKTAIKHLFQHHDLKLFATRPMWFDSFYVSILSEKYRKSKFGFFKGIVIGLVSNLKAIGSGEFSSHIYLIRPKT